MHLLVANPLGLVLPHWLLSPADSAGDSIPPVFITGPSVPGTESAPWPAFSPGPMTVSNN